MTFLVEAPIFVTRQLLKHRAGVSINEESGRYRDFRPVFYMPPADRPLGQTGRAGDYEYVPGPMSSAPSWTRKSASFSPTPGVSTRSCDLPVSRRRWRA